MKVLHLILLLTFLTTAVLARHRRRQLLRRQSSYNKFMRSMALNFEKAKVETLGAIFKRHVQQLRHTPNKQVELVFLIDSSGSVGSHYFYEEVRFVKNLLADFTVDVNSTRVSVITFSSPHKIFRHIDYLSSPSAENHKCRLLEDDIPDVDYAAGGTHTLGAFLEAEKVLRSARADATKAIFLMTDGYSNGGDPRPVAHKLKAQGVRIFTFGIRDGFVWELQDMASEPKNETCYILDSFEEFEALAKRALHTDLQSGSYVSQSISKCGKLCNNGGVCCHQNASCSCGTYTGKYKCLCKPGYYGSGLGKTGCKPCPPGTYKNYTGLGACTPCPDKHQMTPSAADALSLCKCKKGYRNSGSLECTVFRCSKLAPPKHGVFVNNKCNNVFNAACGLKCKSGYELHGSSLRICQEDGQWSGQPAECIMKTCPSLPQPKNGHMICSSDDFSYSTVCRFTCNTGYTLVGSRKRTCLAIAFWTGIATRCREITCPPLVEIKDGTVEPLSCMSSEVVFGTTCKVSCQSGYKLKGPHTKQCTPDGTWMASETGANLCLDESPPLLHCPKDITVPADEKESLTQVFWIEPVPIDNSGLRPVLTSEPSVSSGSEFPIGKTVVTYKAKDLSNNVAECYFIIKVIDKTPPRIDKCVSPPPTVSKAKATAVQFEEPLFSDNSGKPVEVAPSRRLGDLYPLGKTKVVFIAFDSANNNQSCVVDIDVVPHLCMTPEPPANGNITCKKETGGVACHISCEESFAFAEKTVPEYTCQFEEGVWMPETNYPFQDCSAVQIPDDVITPASLTLTSGISCDDQNMLSELVQNLEEEMKNKLNAACEDEMSCKLGDLSFVCENEEGYNKVPQLVSRRRRSVANSHKTKLSLKFSLSGSVQTQSSDELEMQFAKALANMLSSMETLQSQNLDVKGKSVAIDDMLYDINDPEYRCRPGSIISNKTCVSCPAGTSCNLDQTECGKCPRGTYQDRENQTQCIRCPDDKSTVTENCRHVYDCKGLCKPGTFSLTGLAPCETCHQGFYQSDFAGKMCHACGEGRTTPRRGTVSRDGCADLCPSGHASLTGLSPCYPCPPQSYQPKVGQTECLKCPGGGRTDKPGAVYLSQCVTSSDSWDIQADESPGSSFLQFNRCAFENPCRNNGICEDQGNSLFTCDCASGFTGETCEETVEPCKRSPCLNQGVCNPAPNGEFVCQCAEGFTGKYCEENGDDCLPKPCENGGVCVDLVNSFSCNCQPGFTGPTCGDLLDNCDSNPCLNGGACFMDATEFHCKCAEGFAGDLCDQDLDECLSLPCQNDATCVDLPGGYSCTCISGYVGKECQDDFDECTENPCANGGQCVDSIGDFSCDCVDGFTGKRCEEVLSSYYQLNFDDPNILDYAQLTIDNPLTAVTASFWMRTTDDDNQGTPFSYAVRDEPDAFTITDYRNLNIYINGEDVSADLRLNDGQWQHVVFTWSSPRGEWKLYANGLLLDQGYDLSTKRAIPAKGTFIIGQEQDEEGGGFSVGETFLGSLTHLNVWDRELSLRDIENLRYSCQGFEGNVVAWTKVQTALRGGLAKSPSTFCDDCPTPEAPESGSVSFTGVRANDDVTYTCNQGYITAGRSEFKCLVSGKWETSAPGCEPVNCGHPGSPSHGYISGRDFTFGSRVRFQCNRGYELNGPSSLYCDEYGEWDDDVPDCVEIECELPLLSANTIASVATEYVKPGTLVTFTCTPGNKLLSEHDSASCQIDGTFDKSVPTCDPEKCPTPPSIDNGEPKEIKPDYGVGETVQYQCLYGYRFSPYSGNRRGSVNCLPDGDWADDLPECEEILCPDPPFVLNAEAVGDDRYVDAEVTYQCNAGYEGVGKNAITCLDTQSWTRLRMRCRPVECPNPPQIPFGSFTGESYTFGAKVEYHCENGYVLRDNSELSCGEDKTWRGENPVCLPVSCGTPSDIGNGRVNYKSSEFGDVADYTCNPGYAVVGSSRVTCEASGKWVPDIPLCEPQTCHVPPDVAHAVYESPRPSDALVFEDTVRYVCSLGHVMVGASDLVCDENAQWTPEPPVCEKITCPKPLAPYSGSVKGKDLSYSSIISYSCDDNYRLIGVDGRTCQADGRWSDEIPVCQATACEPGTLPNGRIDYKDLSVGSIVSYSCDKGYQLMGDSIRRCRADLTLDGIAPLCNPVDCGDLPTLTNGNIVLSTSNTLFGTTATFTCDTGYSTDGLDNIYCANDGKWSGTVPECRLTTCPKVSKLIQNGRVIGSSFSYASVFTYECKEGYTLNGPADRMCKADGTWDNPAPSCVVITCPKLGIAYGVLSSFDTSIGTTVTYSCRGNYRLEGPKERTCLADGTWSGFDPKCLKIRCAAPPPVDHAKSEVVNETAIEYTCKKGFDLSGSSVRVCERDDIWKPDAPRCIPAFCEDLSSVIIDNGQVLFTSAKVGEIVEYDCNPGYELKGEEKRKCLKSGLWEGEAPKCEKLNCGHPGIVSNGHVVGSDYTYGAVVKFECTTGFTQKGADSIRCEESGNWENLYSNCERVYCPDLGSKIPNGRVYLDSTAYLSIAEYVCKKGFISKGVEQRECLETGEWSGTAPSCVPIVCPTPEVVKSGILIGGKEVYGYGDEIRYECEIGHYLHGKPTRRCTKDATWTEWIPKCYSVRCPEPPYLENGDFKGESGTYQAVLTYFCFEGYQLFGDEKSTCEANGQWSGSDPRCDRIACGPVPSIVNAYPDQNTILFYNTVVQYTCNEGYTPSGNDLSSCLVNSTWSYTDFSCTLISCPSFSSLDIPHGIFNTPSFNYKDRVEFSCEEGYRLSGVNSIECGFSGAWSAALPSCLIIQCPPLGTVSQGSILVDSNDFGSIATISCNLGYILRGSSSLLCLSSGFWDDSLPQCDIVACPTPPPVLNGHLLNSDGPFVFDTTHEYACDFGYELQGFDVLRCTQGGIYNNPAPACKRIVCPEVEDIAFGTWNWFNETFVLYACDSGFNLVGDSVRECALGGVWGGSAPVCRPVPCPSPPSIVNGKVIGSVFTFGQFVEYRCIKGHNLIGSPISVCQEDGTWSVKNAQCMPVNCGEPEDVFENGYINGDVYTYLQTIEYVCLPGFEIKGHNNRTCRKDGEWSRKTPACVRQSCSAPDLITNGAYHGHSFLFESRIYYNCSQGFRLVGEEIRACESTLTWSGSNPVCVRMACSPPVDIPNGYIDGSSYFYEDVIEISCNRGYQLEGSDSRTCQLDQTWSGVDSVCAKIYCPASPPQLTNGLYDYELENVYGVDDTLIYFCLEGYIMNGTGQRLCESSGKWSTNFLQCYPVSCPDVADVHNGAFNSDSPESPFTFGSSLFFSCNQGFSLVGKSTLQCSSSGKWSDSIPFCSIIECKNLEIENGFSQVLSDSALDAVFDREDGTFYAGDNVLIQCISGYELNGVSKTSCSFIGEWELGFGSCQRIQCPNPIIDNGIVTGSSYLFLDEIQISCNRGYRLEGSASRTCQADKTWSNVDSICTRIYCSVPPPQLRNGLRDYELGNVYGVDETLKYFCLEGYIMNGTGQRLCESSGKWSTNFLQCYPVSCPDVADVHNGAFNSDSPESPFTFGSSLFFSCNQGFSLMGKSTLQCGSSGKWSDSIPFCSIIECKNLEIENGFSQVLSDSALDAVFDRQDGTFYAGDNVLIQCNYGYELNGVSKTSCSLKGKWKLGFGSCQRIQCPEPVVDNGAVAGSSYLFLDEIQISCNRGYRLEGSASRTCQADKTWTNIDSICTKIYCPVPPPKLRKGLRDYEVGNVYGVDETLTYFCLEGHVMNGTGQRICEPSGIWSTNVLNCYAIACPAINTFENGVFNSDFPQSPFTYPSSLYFSCDIGFRLVGSSPIKCGSSGKWSEAVPWCSIIECKTLRIENSLRQFAYSGLGAVFVREDGKFYAGDSVSIQCNSGYEITGDTEAYCSNEGYWVTQTDCNPVICQAPEIKGVQFSSVSETYKNKISVSCDDDLDLIGHDELTCGADAAWLEDLPRCEILACGSPPKVTNAVLKGERFNLGDVVNYECKAGYDLIGNSLLTCGPSNEWLGTYPVCVRVDCGQPEALSNSFIDLDSTEFQSTAYILCFDGYELQGNSEMSCGANQLWDVDPTSQCSPLDCGNPPEIPNGSVLPEQTTYQSLAVYTCDAGHVFEGTTSMYCESNGQWAYQVPVCSPVSCLPDPTQVAHASYTKIGSLYLDVVQFECDEGYTFTNPSATTLTCGDMGNWKGDVSDCVVIDCGPPPQFEHAFSSFKATTYSSVVSFYCISGYEANATRVFTCGDDGAWRGDQFECTKKNCFNYPDLIQGEYTQENGTLYQTEVSYNCFEGYEKTGPDFIKCTSEGKWTSPYCAALDCLDPPDVQHGHYRLDATTYESEVKYICDAGYVLAGKSTIECLDTGVWSPTLALCKPLNCHDPPTVENAEVGFNTTVYKDVAIYSCEIGFASSTPMSLSCGETGQWIGAVPTCEVTFCPKPEVPTNGFVDYSETTYSSVATYSCIVGNELIGQNRLTCLENGSWSHEAPKCSALECSNTESIENGKVTTSGRHFGSWSYYSCLEGYILVGDNRIMCNKNGFWSSPAPKCTIVDCKIPPLIAFGNVQYDETTFYSKAIYSCTKGYSLVGNKDSVCQVTGQWSSDEKRECQLIICPRPPQLENGLLISYNDTFGSRAVYQCLADYKPQTLSILTCVDSGTWHGQLPSCNKKLCPEPYSIDNGGFYYDGEPVVNTVVEYYCEQGYDLIGSSEIICTEDEAWSPQTPYCKPVTCTPLTEVPFSTLFQEEDAGFMSIATFQCLDGYTMANENDPDSIEAVYVCGEDGQWEGELFQCNPITCPFYPPLVDHTNYQLTNGNVFDSNAVYTCEIGYVMIGEETLVCDSNGQWTSLFPPVCEIVSCGSPPDVQGASYHDDSFTYGSVVTYSCDPYHRLAGDNTVRCMPDGNWTPAILTCHAIECNALVVPENGKILNTFGEIFIAGSNVMFACNDGFTLVGSETVSCQASGLWDLPSPHCHKVIGVCEESIPVENAVPPPPGKFPGDEILVACKDGYGVTGDMFSTCQDDGSWPIPPGQCQRVSCGRPGSYDRQKVRVFGRSFLYGDSVRYMCRYGFSPVQNPPVLRCLSTGKWDNQASCAAQCKQKCDNGGRCLGLNRCKCMPGWAGFKCHLPICIFPCLNGGRCEAPYKCKCQPGYDGSRCERAICPRQCQNGSRCLRPGKCHCLPGFQGNACEDRVLPSKG